MSCCTLQGLFDLKVIGPANVAVTKASGVDSASVSEGALFLKHVRRASKHKEQGYAFSATYTALTPTQVRRPTCNSSIALSAGRVVS